MFKYYNYLGFYSKYFTENDGNIKLFKNFEQSINTFEKRDIDITAIIEFVNRFYFFGDRSIVQNLYHTPWLSRLNNDSWESDLIDDSKTNIASEKEFMEVFLNILEEEIIDYIGTSKKIGLLLSGGMDSRIVAAILKKLNVENKINVEITGLTWGGNNSRDVIYSKKICELYKWDFKHFDITPETLNKNIMLAAINGCEYSPVHLHAMQDVSNETDLDLILAGSFGDSIGRAEYSGKHVSDIESIGKHIINKFYLINHDLFINNIKNVQSDLVQYYKKFPRKEEYSLLELERQIHYMRRELNSCMAVINEKIPLQQIFTSPKIYNFVLNTDPKFRNDNLYYLLLEKVDKKLLNIPWARTGKPYLNNSIQADNYDKEYHNYGKWIKNDLSDVVEEKILNANIEKLNIFNMSSIRNMIIYNKKYGTDKLNRADELLIWLASLSDMIGIYEVKGINDKKENILKKFKNSIASKVYLFTYLNAIKYLK